MELTLAKVQKRVLLKLGYAGLPPELSWQDVANEAGEWCTSLRQWNFLRRPPLGFNTVMNQEFVDLPANLSGLITGQRRALSGIGIALTDVEVIASMRAGNTIPMGAGLLYGAPVMVEPPAAGPCMHYRLELYPTPNAAIVNAFYLVYRAGWRELVTPADHVALPGWMHRAYIEAVVGHVRAYTKADLVLADVLAPVTRYIESLYPRDANDQDDLGGLEGSAEDNVTGDPLWNLPTKFGPHTLT